MSHDDDLVYHYTDANGLKGILDSGKFWATDMQYLNDSAELTLLQVEAIEELRSYASIHLQHAEIIELAIPMLPLESGSHYSISFSEDPDSLSQWRGYGGVQGYAIGFSKDSLARVAQNDDDGARFGSCEYDPTVRAAQISKTVRDAISMLNDETAMHSPTWGGAPAELAVNVAGGFGAVAPFIKHESFHEEHEFRIVVHSVSGGRIRVRNRSGELVPYIEVSAPVGTSGSEVASMNGLRSIVIGPTATRKRMKSLSAYLSYLGLQTTIELSSTPYLP
ncbi:DUF2971 domain-containing protein [Subtercola lobariae]|uniref:DUF2971 domain-containing protein n=1 Tax=Subtercola lobariae TaxID=1588641 RepID=A0A917B3Z6_9MICO|nr:DUF2971 domain-containing protein [Subtercola lobariae]GGF18191.1 hypothetical protein GCM10011399_09860 [Subtercola lobariae]